MPSPDTSLQEILGQEECGVVWGAPLRCGTSHPAKLVGWEFPHPQHILKDGQSSPSQEGLCHFCGQTEKQPALTSQMNFVAVMNARAWHLLSPVLTTGSKLGQQINTPWGNPCLQRPGAFLLGVFMNPRVTAAAQTGKNHPLDNLGANTPWSRFCSLREIIFVQWCCSKTLLSLCQGELLESCKGRWWETWSSPPALGEEGGSWALGLGEEESVSSCLNSQLPPPQRNRLRKDRISISGK